MICTTSCEMTYIEVNDGAIMLALDVHVIVTYKYYYRKLADQFYNELELEKSLIPPTVKSLCKINAVSMTFVFVQRKV